MATKVEITNDLRKQYGNVMSQNQVRQYLGAGHEETSVFLEDIPFWRESRKKRFLVIDVAKKLHERMQTAS